MGKGQENESARPRTQLSGSTHISEHYLNPGFLILEMKYLCPGILIKLLPAETHNAPVLPDQTTRSAGWCDYVNSPNWPETVRLQSPPTKREQIRPVAPRGSLKVQLVEWGWPLGPTRKDGLHMCAHTHQLESCFVKKCRASSVTAVYLGNASEQLGFLYPLRIMESSVFF